MMFGTAADASAAGPRLDAAAAAAPLGGSLASSGWRYSYVAQSTDSEGFLDATEPAMAGIDAELSAAGDPWRAASPAGCAGAAAGAEPGRQLWSPSKRPAQHMAAPVLPSAQHPHQHQLGAGGGGSAGAAAGAAAAAGAPALHLALPPGVDAASYAAGERAAFMMAFQQALPGQQALGQLFSGEV